VPEQLLLSQEGAVVIEVVAGAAAAARGDALVVRVAPYTRHTAAREATIGVAVADPALAQALTEAIVHALGQALGHVVAQVPGHAHGHGHALGHTSERAPEDAHGQVLRNPAPADDPLEPANARVPTVRVRSRKGLTRDAGRLGGAIAIVPVTARNARHLVALVHGARAAGAVGVQLVWDGADPPRAAVEHHVFAALERVRATPGEPPVVLAATDQPVSALHFLVAHRSTEPDASR
jgi:hypothetical protein